MAARRRVVVAIYALSMAAAYVVAAAFSLMAIVSLYQRAVQTAMAEPIIVSCLTWVNVKVINVDNTCMPMLRVEMAYLVTGMSCSPSSTVRSSKRFFALSSWACTVLFWTLNSLMTLVPEAYDWVARSWAVLTWSRCEATAERTPTARVPFSCISSNIGAISANPPLDFMAERNVVNPSFALVFIKFENFVTSTPAIFANLAGS